jgi:hypothetical protein
LKHVVPRGPGARGEGKRQSEHDKPAKIDAACRGDTAFLYVFGEGDPGLLVADGRLAGGTDERFMTGLEVGHPGGFIQLKGKDIGARDAAAEDTARKLGEIFVFQGLEVADGDFGLVRYGLEGKVAPLALRSQGTAESGHRVTCRAKRVSRGI